MKNQTNKCGVLLVDPLAEDGGHLIADDLYLARCLMPLASSLEVKTSPASVKNIELHIKGIATPLPEYRMLSRFARLKGIMKMLALSGSKHEHVVFQSYEDVSTLVYMLLNPRKKIHLVVCNNLTPARMKRHPILVPLVLAAVFKRATTIFVSCQFEIDLISERFKSVDLQKVVIKPFHQMAVSRVRLEWQNKSDVILFVGPALLYKDIDPVIDLIENDMNQNFRYIFCSMQDIPGDKNSRLDGRENVHLMFGFTPDEQYYKLLTEAKVVIMTHDHSFEGRLSGIFCDAIASGTPVIAREMAPHTEFFERFGPMGFLVDYSNPDWCKQVLSADLENRYEEFQRNMAACRNACGMASIRRVFQSALDVK